MKAWHTKIAELTLENEFLEDALIKDAKSNRGKSKVIHRRGPWRSFEAVEFATLEWIDWFNRRRLLEPIGNIPPAEAERNYYAAMDNIPMAA